MDTKKVNEDFSTAINAIGRLMLETRGSSVENTLLEISTMLVDAKLHLSMETNNTDIVGAIHLWKQEKQHQAKIVHI